MHGPFLLDITLTPQPRETAGLLFELKGTYVGYSLDRYLDLIQVSRIGTSNVIKGRAIDRWTGGFETEISAWRIDKLRVSNARCRMHRTTIPSDPRFTVTIPEDVSSLGKHVIDGKWLRRPENVVLQRQDIGATHIASNALAASPSEIDHIVIDLGADHWAKLMTIATRHNKACAIGACAIAADVQVIGKDIIARHIIGAAAEFGKDPIPLNDVVMDVRIACAIQFNRDTTAHTCIGADGAVASKEIARDLVVVAMQQNARCATRAALSQFPHHVVVGDGVIENLVMV